MITYRSIFLTMVLLFIHVVTFAQKMTGKVIDEQSKEPMEGVEVLNIYTNDLVYTDSMGRFEIAVSKGQLIEFSALGYDVERVRINTLPLAKFYNIAMRVSVITLEEVNIWNLGRGKWTVDSASNAKLYEKALKFYKLEGMDILEHPFDTMSKKNRQIWAFQKHYEYFEKEKYVDYIFNDRIIAQLTNLGSDSLVDYMRIYRPSYDFIQQSSLYNFYEYIKNTVTLFRKNAYYRQEE